VHTSLLACFAIKWVAAKSGRVQLHTRFSFNSRLAATPALVVSASLGQLAH